VSLSSPPLSAQEQFLLELTQWLGHVLQYSASHPSCARLGERTHRTLQRALEVSSPLEVGVLKDGLTFGETDATHAALKTRTAPHLHERGVLLLRFAHGTSLAELASFVELLALPVQTIFDRGGLVRLTMDRGVTRVQVEEISHDITEEEREEQRRRKRLRTFFNDMLKNLLARRAAGFSIAEQLLELLEHPEIAAALLQEDTGSTLAEAVAGLALMVLQEERKTGVVLRPKMCAVLFALPAEARDRLLLGFPPLVGEFRSALAWVFDGLGEDELARFGFHSVRAHADDIDGVLYALGVVAPSHGRRLGALRRLALSLYELPPAEAETDRVLRALTCDPGEHDSFRAERDVLAGAAQRALDVRRAALGPGESKSSSLSAAIDRANIASGAQRAVADLLKMASTTRDFEKVCAKLPAALRSGADGDGHDVFIGVVTGLVRARPSRADAVDKALAELAGSPAPRQALRELDRASASLEGPELEAMAGVVSLLATSFPAPALEQLEASENRKMRRLLLDGLPGSGKALLPLLRPKLKSPSWFVVRNIVSLLPRAGGTAADLVEAARHAHERVRLEVVRALRAVAQDRAAMDVAVALLTDPSEDVRKAARVSIRGDLLGPEAIAKLEALAESDEQPEELRRLAVQALGQSPDDRAARALFKLLQPRGLIEIGSGSSHVRDLAAAALRRSSAPSAPDQFAQGLRSSVGRVRKACERAAGKGDA
jgi:hypothetical protein